MQWSGPENIAQVKIDDESSWALFDSCSKINAVTPEFVKACSLDMGPLSNLVDGTWKINCCVTQNSSKRIISISI